MIQGDGVRPLFWYRKTPETYDFTSTCLATHPTQEGDFVRRGEANYRRFYLYYVRKLVRALKDEPGIFAWAIGNELRALGLGNAGGALGKLAQQRLGIDTFAAFLADMVAEIRAIDPNHMIMPGVQHMGEVADADLSNPQDVQDLVEYAMPKMLAVGFDLWNLTFYDNNAHIAEDIDRFRAHNIPVIATEWDTYDCALSLTGQLCSLFDRGLQMVAPWSPIQMLGKCADWGTRIHDGMLRAFEQCSVQPAPEPVVPAAPQCVAGQCSDCDDFWQDRGGWGDTTPEGQATWQQACFSARSLTVQICSACAGFNTYSRVQ